MLIFDLRIIGNQLLTIRKRAGLTRNEVAEAAGLSERTYADIERGSTNMRIGTLLCICQALSITPDDILIKQKSSIIKKKQTILEKLEACSLKEKETALNLLSVYLDSLH